MWAVRLLHAARLSRLGDASTGIDTQDEKATRYAESSGHEIIATAPDTDISGDTDPWHRPELGPWLSNTDLIAQYDGIVASHVDRLARSTIHFMRLLHWADDTCGNCPTGAVRKHHVKRIITTGENGIDFSTPVGKLLGYIISWLGEQELEAIKRRSSSTRKWLLDNGYLVSRPPFGYRVAPKGEHKTLEPDPHLIPYLRGMIDRALDGSSLVDIGRWLETKNIQPGIWGPKTVGRILRNPILYGRQMSRDGTRTVLRVEPVITLSKWKQLQRTLDANPRRRGPASDIPALLTGVLFCRKCEGVMHFRRTVKRRNDGSKRAHKYYRCDGTYRERSSCRNMIRVDATESHIDWLMSGGLEGVSDLEVVKRITIPGSDYGEDLDQVNQDITELVSRYTADEIEEDEYDTTMTALRTERNRLRSLPAEPDRTDDQPTGRTVGEHWRTMDETGKRAYLLTTGLQFYAERSEDGVPLVSVVGPPNIVESVTRF